MKYIILILAFVFISFNQTHAHQPHYDAFLNRLSHSLSTPSYELIKNNIKVFKVEAHYKNDNKKLDKQLKNILTANKFNKIAYTNIMRRIYSKEQKIDVSKSANIIEKLNRKERKAFYQAMKDNNS